MDLECPVVVPDWGKNVQVTRGTDGVLVPAECTYYDEVTETGVWEYEGESGEVVVAVLAKSMLPNK